VCAVAEVPAAVAHYWGWPRRCMHCFAMSMRTIHSCIKLVMQPFYVQVGQHYLAAQWGQRLMTLSSFIDQHLLSTAPDSSTDAGA
jgi:hypothetical protein